MNEQIAAEADTHDFTEEVKGVSLTQDAWKRLKKNKMAIFGLIVVTLYALVSILAPILPLYSYSHQVLEHVNLPPAIFNGFKNAGELWLEKEEAYLQLVLKSENRNELTQAERQKLAGIRDKIANQVAENEDGEMVNPHTRIYLLGTDYLGRDMLARIIYGGQVSIMIGLLGTLVSVVIGIIFGALAGYLGGKVDYMIMRVVDVMYGLPYMLLVIILMAIFGNNIYNLFIALSLVSWLTVARVVRGQIISLKNSEFVEAARSMGAGTWRVIFQHLVPNTAGVIIVFSTLRVPQFIMQEAFLSFLGLGISAPYASWGSLVQDAVEGMSLNPHRLFFPALAMTLFLFAMNFLGDGLRDAFDPHSKNRQ
ncbi:peptide ABC transporter permease [Spirochaeta lutea]|uniref:Oligopeptide transport system permease protein OppC n=1 Tax=Spirochaeta lutea TaxID=1480694 RepID=A0A098QX83_9SPIO|nr:peptide ABC transporter permease [Spirochaeta lutea]